MDFFKNIISFWLTLCFTTHFCNGSLINDTVSKCGILIKSLWNMKLLFEEFQNIRSHPSELHQMQKVVMFTMEKLISKFININATITRFVQ